MIILAKSFFFFFFKIVNLFPLIFPQSQNSVGQWIFLNYFWVKYQEKSQNSTFFVLI